MVPDTLNNLYKKGIIDYTPYEVLYSPASPNAYNMTNPYLNMAAQAGLYQKSINSGDSFNSSNMNFNGSSSMNNMDYTMHNPYSSLVSQFKGINSIAANNAYAGNSYGNMGIGSVSSAGGMNSLGFNGSIGTNSTAAMNAGFGEAGIGIQNTNAGTNALGGFGSFGNWISSLFGENSGLKEKVIKGLIGLSAIIIGGKMLFKSKKKAPKQTTSFLSKLNPLNWFKKTEKPKFHIPTK